MCRQCVPFGVLRQHRPPASIDAQDQRAAIEGAEHDRDAAVRGEVRVRLVPRSAEVEIGDLGIGENAEAVGIALGRQVAAPIRSEEHTSELQSLMRTSYAVFCSKKNNQTQYIRYDTDKHTSSIK